MNIEQILKLSEFFQSLAAKEELPPNSKDLKTVLKNIEELENYNSRKKYADKNLKKLSSGSSRLVYLTPDETVIKLAKNDRGLAQNKAEANPKMKSKFLNKIIGSSKNNVWIETYYLDKITAKEFEKMTGIKFDDFGDCVRYGLKSISHNSDMKKPKNFETIEKSEIYKEMKRIGKMCSLMPGDIAKISSFGQKDGHPVLLDYGLTKEIFYKFYDTSS